MSQTRWERAVADLAPLPDYLWIDGRRVPAGTADDINRAVDVAQAAMKGPWASISPRERERLLWQVGERPVRMLTGWGWLKHRIPESG